MHVLFWASLAVLFYTYAGYPLLVMVLGRIRRMPVHAGSYEPAVSIIIAARNEATSIRATLENKLQLQYAAGRVQIIVVSDASMDGTDAIVREFESAGVLLLRQEPHRGKTAALNLAAAHGRIRDRTSPVRTRSRVWHQQRVRRLHALRRPPAPI